MGYSIAALIGRQPALAVLDGAHPQRRVIALAQGFGLIPLTEALYDGLAARPAPHPLRRYSSFRST